MASKIPKDRGVLIPKALKLKRNPKSSGLFWSEMLSGTRHLSHQRLAALTAT
jgi:hypothetical protein